MNKTFLFAIGANAQVSIPRNQEQDSDKVMSRVYWDIWNPDVQARIDADIDKYRKSDAYFVIPGLELPGEPTVSGLFTRDMQPKTSYYALEELILNEWRTNLTVKSDRNGGIQFRGFKGSYRLTWTDRNGEHSREFHLK